MQVNLLAFTSVYWRLFATALLRSAGRGCLRPRGGWCYRPRLALLRGARRRGGRAAEGARLESVYAGNRIAGSNPAPSASSPENRWLMARRSIEMAEKIIASNFQKMSEISRWSR